MTGLPQLCLALTESGVDADRLTELLDAVPFASARMPASCSALVAVCQAGGAAALIEDDVNAVREFGADGVHLTLAASGGTDTDTADANTDDDAPSPAAGHLRAVREKLGPDRIIGADAGPTRHLAMELAEAGADYVAFDPSAGFTTDNDFEAHIAWWTALFEVPCVAQCRSPEEASRVIAAQPEFIEIAWPAQTTAAEADRRVRQIAQAVLVTAETSEAGAS